MKFFNEKVFHTVKHDVHVKKKNYNIMASEQQLKPILYNYYYLSIILILIIENNAAALRR